MRWETNEETKAHAEDRMREYDRFPKEHRDLMKEYGSFTLRGRESYTDAALRLKERYMAQQERKLNEVL